ncbi:hypothetical protein LZ32DRAFT_663760 [Colletotrichum eremochloae]|nr:hypothetical protein LZ32DRAFT_663760 [Colletotrichum eremochloae]
MEQSQSPIACKLRRLKISDIPSTSLFTGQHSRLPGNVVAKVIRYTGRTVVDLFKCAMTSQQEETVLEKLQTPSHLRSLMAACPPSTSTVFPACSAVAKKRPSRSTRPAGSCTTSDVTSTLAYLTTRRIVHNDIKPADIPSSSENGAILLDFGLATASDAPVKLDGTPLGAPGHVWALAITMLYVCEKTKMPQRTSKGWLIRDVVDKSISERLQMMKWLDAVGQERERLQSADVVEDLVYKMLDPIATTRIDAV